MVDAARGAALSPGAVGSSALVELLRLDSNLFATFALIPPKRLNATNRTTHPMSAPRHFSRLRSALLAVAFIAAPGLAAAQEPTAIFVVDTSDGYGIDNCVASGASCGQAMADAWCRVHDYERAVSFGTMKSDATLSSVRATPVRTACYGGTCAETVAITCSK